MSVEKWGLSQEALAPEPTPVETLLTVVQRVQQARQSTTLWRVLAEGLMALTGAQRVAFFTLIQGELVQRHGSGGPQGSWYGPDGPIAWPLPFHRATVDEAMDTRRPAMRRERGPKSGRASGSLLGARRILALPLCSSRSVEAVAYLEVQGDASWAAPDLAGLEVLTAVASEVLVQLEPAAEPDAVTRDLHVIRAALDSSPTPLLLFSDRHVFFRNQAAHLPVFTRIAAEIGRLLERVHLGELSVETLPSGLVGEIVHSMLECATSGTTMRFEATTEIEGSLHIFDVRVHDCGERALNAIAVRFDDVTSRRMAEETMREAGRVSTVEALASTLAHDFNNMLTVIQATAEFLRDADEIPLTLAPAVEDLLQANAQARGLTARLLDFARRRPAERHAFSAMSIVDLAVSFARRALGERHALVVDTPATAGQLDGDPVGLQQAILNLILNARDAAPAGTTIELRTAVAAGRTPNGVDGTRWCLDIVDHGPGLPDAVRERLFQPFVTTKAPGKGTGLGLASAYNIVQRHNGRLSHHPTPGGGATFRIELPIFVPAALGPVSFPTGGQASIPPRRP